MLLEQLFLLFPIGVHGLIAGHAHERTFMVPLNGFAASGPFIVLSFFKVHSVGSILIDLVWIDNLVLLL